MLHRKNFKAFRKSSYVQSIHCPANSGINVTNSAVQNKAMYLILLTLYVYWAILVPLCQDKCLNTHSAHTLLRTIIWSLCTFSKSIPSKKVGLDPILSNLKGPFHRFMSPSLTLSYVHLLEPRKNRPSPYFLGLQLFLLQKAGHQIWDQVHILCILYIENYVKNLQHVYFLIHVDLLY